MKTLTQTEKTLALLKTAGPIGVNSFDLTYKHGIKQGPKAIHDLKQLGYLIASKRRRNGSKTYYLAGEPENAPKPEEPKAPMEWHFDKDGKAWLAPAKGPEQEVLL